MAPKLLRREADYCWVQGTRGVGVGGEEVRVTLKVSFASSYFRLSNHLTEGDIFVEVEELSVALSAGEKRDLQ